MINEEAAEYMEKIKLCKEESGELSEECLKYYKTMFTFLRMGNTEMQAFYEKKINEAMENDDYAGLKSIFYQNAKLKLLPVSSGGYDHCANFWQLLDLLACDRFDNIYRILPDGLLPASNGYAMYVHGTNLLLCLLYNKGENNIYDRNKIVEKAEKFAASKKPVWERAVVSCLLGIIKHDVSMISEGLQNVCEGYTKANVAKFMKIQCQNVYGLIVLAKNMLTEEEFAGITFPEYRNFSKKYAEWLLSQKELTAELCMDYEEPLEQINDILKKPVAVTKIWQPYLDSDNSYLSAKEKKEWHMDCETMLKEFLK